MKSFAKRCISALIAAVSVLTLTVPTAMAEEMRKLPSGIKYEDIESKFDKELNYSSGDGIDYYAGYEAIVFCGDEILYEGYFGDTDRENNIPCSEDSVMEWGSISKTFIWVSAMQLWEQGKLDLNADIRDYLPDGFFKHLSYDAPITMMNIMDHTGGWCEGTYAFSTPDRDKLTSLALSLQETEPAQVNPPGEVISYSNWGAALGAFVIECISGMDYVEYVHKNIFEPLGMEHTSIAADFSDNEWVRTQRDKLKSYRFKLINYKSEGNKISYIKLFPSGSAAGTIRDLATYAQAFVNDDAPLFLHKETQEKLFSGSQFYGNTDIPLASYGFATEEYKVRVYGHNGATIACNSNMIFDLKSKTGLVTLTNETSANLLLDSIPKLIFGTPDIDGFSDGNIQKKPLDGCYLISRSQRAGLLKFTSYLSPINADLYPDLVRLGDGFYTLEGTGMMLSASKRSSGTESYISGAMEIDKDSAYPAEITLLALYFIAAIGAVFVLLFKVKAARNGRYHASAVGTVLTVGQIIKLLSVAAAVVLIAYVGREATYGLPKAVGVTAGIVNIICVVICALAAIAAVIGIASKRSGKWLKAGYSAVIASNVIMIFAIVYFEMFQFWAC